MQAEGLVNESKSHYKEKYGRGPYSVFQNIIKISQAEGPKALFKGV